MKVYYARVSTIDQNEARQTIGLTGYDYIFVDKCSGSIPIFERPKGNQIYELIVNQKLKEITIDSIDRLGRNLQDILIVWNDLTKKNIKIICQNPGICNFNKDGKPDGFSKVIMSIMGIMAELELNRIKERQNEGIRIAKLEGKYKGRKVGTKETPEDFLKKPKNQKIKEYLNSGYTYKEICKILNVSSTTVNKVSKIL